MPPSRASCAQNLIFRFLQNKTRIQVWLFENTDLRIEGRIIVRASRGTNASTRRRPRAAALTAPRRARAAGL